MWEQQGDFSRVYESGDDLCRFVKYLQSNPESLIRSIELLGYRGGGCGIRIEVANHEVYDRLHSATQRAGFPKRDFFYRDIKTLLFFNDSQDTSNMASYIQTILSETNELQEILPRIERVFNFNFQVHHTVTRWIKSGDFSRVYESGGDLCRFVKYQQGGSNTIIDKTEFLGYRDGSYLMVVSLTNAADRGRLIALIQATGIQSWVGVGLPKVIKVLSNTIHGLTRCFDALISIDQHFQEISEGLFAELQQLDIVSEATLGLQQQSEVCKRNYENLLEDLNFSEDQIPEKFICKISGQIMTEPVFDPRHPQVFYEKSIILKWLDESLTNPFTREALAPTELKVANVLEYDLDKFVSSVINKRQLSEPENILLPPIRLVLQSKDTLFNQLDDDYIIDNRGKDPALQHEYDRRHGIMLVS